MLSWLSSDQVGKIGEGGGDSGESPHLTEAKMGNDWTDTHQQYLFCVSFLEKSSFPSQLFSKIKILKM